MYEKQIFLSDFENKCSRKANILKLVKTNKYKNEYIRINRYLV